MVDLGEVSGHVAAGVRTAAFLGVTVQVMHC
jgi:hypothetical protein